MMGRHVRAHDREGVLHVVRGLWGKHFSIGMVRWGGRGVSIGMREGDWGTTEQSEK